MSGISNKLKKGEKMTEKQKIEVKKLIDSDNSSLWEIYKRIYKSDVTEDLKDDFMIRKTHTKKHNLAMERIQEIHSIA